MADKEYRFYASLILGLVAIVLSACMSSAQATLIVVEPDDFLPGEDIGKAVSGISISVVGQPSVTVVATTATMAGGCGGTPAVSSCASTGTLVFGRNVPSNGDHWQQGLVELRIDFINPTDFVSIDFAGIDDGGAELRAFSSGGDLITTYSAFLVGPGSIITATINRPLPDIAYIMAGGVPGESNLLDNFQFSMTPVPEPSTLALLSISILFLLGFIRSGDKTRYGFVDKYSYRVIT